MNPAINLDNEPFIHTIGYCEINYCLQESVAHQFHVSTLDMMGDHFKQYINEQESFLLYIEVKNPIYLNCKIFCAVLEDKQTLKHLNTYLEVV